MELIERAKREQAEKEALYEEMKRDPIDLDALFLGLVKTIRYDYVGFVHKQKYFMPNESRTYVLTNHRYGTLTMEMLCRSLHQFVAEMHDRHLRLRCDDWIDYKNLSPRYRVRAAKDCLYVTEADADTGLVPGDRILAVQSMPPERIRAFLRNVAFHSNEPERELWGGYLRMAKSLEVEHRDGRRERLELALKPACPAEYPVEFRLLEGNAAYLKLEKMDRDTMARLLEDHGAEIARSEKLVLDLRRCVGGEEDACWALFPYLVDRPRTLEELLNDEGSYVLFTENNCSRRYEVLSAFRDSLTDPEEIALIEGEMALYKDNYGKGLTFLPPEPAEDVTYIPAPKAPQKVVVITDTFCEDEGEQFVAMCKRCGGKVTVIGRPTMGNLDYFDIVNVAVHEHITLSYPIRMTKAAYEGQGISEKGLPVDEYIPWTPGEIDEDLLLKRALEI